MPFDPYWYSNHACKTGLNLHLVAILQKLNFFQLESAGNVRDATFLLMHRVLVLRNAKKMRSVSKDRSNCYGPRKREKLAVSVTNEWWFFKVVFANHWLKCSAQLAQEPVYHFKKSYRSFLGTLMSFGTVEIRIFWKVDWSQVTRP